MSSYTSIFKRFGNQIIAIGSGFILSILFVELLLHLLPVKTGLVRPENSSLKQGVLKGVTVNTWQPKTSYTSSTGWSLHNVRHGSTNNYGYIAPFDYHPGQKALVVIGDSYIEAQMNDYEQTVQGILGNRLKYPVYSIGYSGFTLADYLAAAQFVSREFSPVAIVITLSDGDILDAVETSVEGAYYVDGLSQGNKLELKRPFSSGQESRFRNISKYSATLRYLWLNLQVQQHLTPLQNWLTGGRRVKQAELTMTQKQKLADFLLSEFSKLSIPASRVVFVIDGDRTAVYSGNKSSRDPIYGYFIKTAREMGFKVVDLEPVFRENYGNHGLKFDYSPRDKHWNFLGHNIVAQQVESVLIPSLGSLSNK